MEIRKNILNIFFGIVKKEDMSTQVFERKYHTLFLQVEKKLKQRIFNFWFNSMEDYCYFVRKTWIQFLIQQKWHRSFFIGERRSRIDRITIVTKHPRTIPNLLSVIPSNISSPSFDAGNKIVLSIKPSLEGVVYDVVTFIYNCDSVGSTLASRLSQHGSSRGTT